MPVKTCLPVPDMDTIFIYYTRIPDQVPGDYYWQLLSLLPDELQQKNLRYKQWRDRLLNLAGKLLLIEALRPFGFAANCLERLQYNQFNRPYIPGNIDFNISHAGSYVLCAIAPHVKVGIDVEQIRPVNFSDLDGVMTHCQWKAINDASDPLKLFYSYWAIKESVIKADCRGLSIPLTTIAIGAGFATCETNTWWLHPVNIDTDYCASLAVNQPCMNTTLVKRLLLQGC